LAGDEELLAGVEQLCDSGHYSTNRKHRDEEDDMAISPRWIEVTGIDRGRRAASNGGQRSSAHDDEAKLVKQIVKKEEEE
jgi:hypothetical protein